MSRSLPCHQLQPHIPGTEY